MCNSDITIEILEKAIEDEATNAKSGGFLGLFKRGSPQKQRVNQPLPRQQPLQPLRGSRQPELPQQPLERQPGDEMRVRDYDSVVSSQDRFPAGALAGQLEPPPARGRPGRDRSRDASGNRDSSANLRDQPEESSFANLYPRAPALQSVVEEQSSPAHSTTNNVGNQGSAQRLNHRREASTNPNSSSRRADRDRRERRPRLDR